MSVHGYLSNSFSCFFLLKDDWVMTLFDLMCNNASSSAGFPLGCFSINTSHVVCCTICLIPIGIRSSRTPPFLSRESRCRAAFTLPLSINGLKFSLSIQGQIFDLLMRSGAPGCIFLHGVRSQCYHLATSSTFSLDGITCSFALLFCMRLL